jgi:hypothetical protein
MAVETANRFDYWEVLQEPSVSTRIPATFLLLLSALDTGWRLSGPILYSTPPSDESPGKFRIHIEQEESEASCSIMINQCQEVEDFIRREGILVVRDEWFHKRPLLADERLRKLYRLLTNH